MQEGPKTTYTQSCSGCVHCEAKHYRVQGDNGYLLYCIHPKFSPSGNDLSSVGKRHIGDTNWTTPEWCPVLEAQRSNVLKLSAQLTEAVAEVLRKSNIKFS
jgi:hypothetical protein